jgi:hypothetical protein
VTRWSTSWAYPIAEYSALVIPTAWYAYPGGLLAAGVEDVDAFYGALKAKGITFLTLPTHQPLGAAHGILY